MVKEAPKLSVSAEPPQRMASGTPTFEELCRPGGGLIAAKDNRAANTADEIKRDVACALLIAQCPDSFNAQGQFQKGGPPVQKVFNQVSDYFDMPTKQNLGGKSKQLTKLAEKVHSNPLWRAVQLPERHRLLDLVERALFRGARLCHPCHDCAAHSLMSCLLLPRLLLSADVLDQEPTGFSTNSSEYSQLSSSGSSSPRLPELPAFADDQIAAMLSSQLSSSGNASPRLPDLPRPVPLASHAEGGMGSSSQRSAGRASPAREDAMPAGDADAGATFADGQIEAMFANQEGVLNAPLPSSDQLKRTRLAVDAQAISEEDLNELQAEMQEAAERWAERKRQRIAPIVYRFRGCFCVEFSPMAVHAIEECFLAPARGRDPEFIGAFGKLGPVRVVGVVDGEYIRLDDCPDIEEHEAALRRGPPPSERARAAASTGFDAKDAGEYAAAKAAFLDAFEFDSSKPEYLFSAANVSLQIGTEEALCEAKVLFTQLAHRGLPPVV